MALALVRYSARASAAPSSGARIIAPGSSLARSSCYSIVSDQNKIEPVSSPLSPLWVAVPELAELRWFVAVGGMGSASSSGNNTSTTALPSGLRPLTFILSKFLASPPEVGLGRVEQLIMKQYSSLSMNTMGCLPFWLK